MSSPLSRSASVSTDSGLDALEYAGEQNPLDETLGSEADNASEVEYDPIDFSSSGDEELCPGLMVETFYDALDYDDKELYFSSPTDDDLLNTRLMPIEDYTLLPEWSFCNSFSAPKAEEPLAMAQPMEVEFPVVSRLCYTEDNMSDESKLANNWWHSKMEALISAMRMIDELSVLFDNWSIADAVDEEMPEALDIEMVTFENFAPPLYSSTPTGKGRAGSGMKRGRGSAASTAQRGCKRRVHYDSPKEEDSSRAKKQARRA